MADLISKYQLQAVTFQQCMHGGQRDKWSTFYTNAPWLQVLVAVCDGNHKHLPWGVTQNGTKVRFNTAEEAEYPQLLCSRIAEAAKAAALKMGAQSVISAPKSNVKPVPFKMAAAGKQPRGNRHPELSAEFHSILDVRWPFPKAKHLPRALQHHESSRLGISQPAKILTCLRREPHDGEDEELVAKIGIFRSPQQFLKEAQKLVHPFDTSFMIEDDVKKNIFFLLTEGPAAMERRRTDVLKYYLQRKEELAWEEEKLHRGLSDRRKCILEDKCLLLFREMCRDAKVEDDGLLDLQLLGTPLTGTSGPMRKSRTNRP